jgi:hypothetical protein
LTPPVKRGSEPRRIEDPDPSLQCPISETPPFQAVRRTRDPGTSADWEPRDLLRAFGGRHHPVFRLGLVAPASLTRGWPARSGCGAILARSNHLPSRSRPSLALLASSAYAHWTVTIPRASRAQSAVVLRILAAAAAAVVAVAAVAPLVSPSTPDLPILVAPRSRWSAAGG